MTSGDADDSVPQRGKNTEQKKKQQEWDQQFYAKVEDMKKRTPSMSKEEVLIIELNDLENLLTNQVKAEKFEKASITKKKITNIKNQAEIIQIINCKIPAKAFPKILPNIN